MNARRRWLLPLALTGVLAAVGTGQAPAAAPTRSPAPAAPVLEVPKPLDPAAADQVRAVTAALETYWAGQLGAAWSPPRSDYLLVDTANRPSAAQLRCAASAEALRGNAFYCPGQDGIVIDAAALLPVLRYSYGGGAVTASLAHEFGHLVQARLGPTAEQRRSDPARYPNLLLEQQADCMAGAFLGAVGSGGTSLPQQQFADATAMQTLGPLLDFHDDAAALPAADDRHGTALQRARAVGVGTASGVGSCRAMTVQSARLSDSGAGNATDPPGSTPRFASDAALRTAVQQSLTRFSPTAADPAATRGQRWQAAARYGQFAQATTAALQSGAARNRSSAGCFAGAWAAATVASATPGGLGRWPGDPDEAIAAIQHWPGATSADLTGFVTGYDEGLPACGG